ncbi:MAG: hypothetical protein SVV03_01300 [Candidatus Nanohaloarchaea archaeon]|nr:hypothetical protein [Candidatus Nanohaloarchaea archaeon]
MKTDTELKGVIGFSIIVGILSAYLTRQAIFAPQAYVESAIIFKVFFSSVNAVLLAGLVFNYIQIYRDMPTPTSRIFLIFSSALMFYAISSNPLVHLLFGYEFIPLGPFTYLPDLFVTAATVAILWESYK